MAYFQKKLRYLDKFLPAIQKQILKSTGFEKIDDSTFAGVVPIKLLLTPKFKKLNLKLVQYQILERK